MTTLPSFLAPSRRVCSRAGPFKLAISATDCALAAFMAVSSGPAAVAKNRAFSHARIMIGFMVFPLGLCGAREPAACSPAQWLNATALTIGYCDAAVHDLYAGKRIIVHAHEFPELTGVIDTRQRHRERKRMRVKEARPDMSAKPEPH